MDAKRETPHTGRTEKEHTEREEWTIARIGHAMHNVNVMERSVAYSTGHYQSDEISGAVTLRFR